MLIKSIYHWATQLASESRRDRWINEWYVWPSSIAQLLEKLESMEGCIIGLIGFQGVGKSSALLALKKAMLRIEFQERVKKKKSLIPDSFLEDDGVVLFKWRREPQLLESLVDGTHEVSSYVDSDRAEMLLPLLKRHLPTSQEPSYPEDVNVAWAEMQLGLTKSQIKESRKISWLRVLRWKKMILIDTPDYSKTDKRMMGKDLDGICWLWNYLLNGSGIKPNFVIAIQKEMFGGHFFFDKMIKIDLKPLTSEQMLEAYKKCFKTTDPFTEEALLTLARMSRGIFRRFLRYITLTLDLWMSKTQSKEHIEPEIVKEAVTTKRLADDMELELTELFPKQSELKPQAVQLLLHLSEKGSKNQNQLSEDLELKPYTISRILAKLESHNYIRRTRDGNEKTVNMTTP
ncbi:hypothetical protein A3K80_03815 [Candidatus Bathyarchaeota archaeon RBG_13_38_9]|nr:MAG: hypothetical protein A3K80_03815 [Candidatus Bathyarchaeota archaeon RBG_13_38_9]